ncbi:hypothetical protein [Borreliella turdi]|uniref:hypothetical protein n=1 Tax=Borreliella turdi TaxID=57863 RepID=UPI001F1AA87B|nr:hypothetical protein [Borreliella turdi]
MFYLHRLEEGEGLYYSASPADSVIMRKCYFKKFASGNVKSVFFKKLDVNVYSESFKRLDEGGGKRNLTDFYPSYYMEFVVIDNGFLMNFQNVIFDGINAKIYNQYHMVNQEGFKSSRVAYSQIDSGSNVNYKKKMGQYSVRVVNVFKISINTTLFNFLLKRKTLKITLITDDNKEYNLETDNFLLKYDF